jgi:hypothetical protein
MPYYVRLFDPAYTLDDDALSVLVRQKRGAAEGSSAPAVPGAMT